MEVLFKVGDSGTMRDGDPIAVKPDGWLIGDAAMEAWIDADTEPSVVAAMPAYLQRRLRRGVLGLQYDLAHTAEEVAELRLDLSLRLSRVPAEMREEVRSKCIARAQADYVDRAPERRLNMVTYGEDTNWGWSDLKLFGTVRLADNLHLANTIMERDEEVSAAGTWKGKRRNRINFRVGLSVEEIQKLENTELYVPCRRSVVTPASIIVEDPRVGLA